MQKSVLMGLKAMGMALATVALGIVLLSLVLMYQSVVEQQQAKKRDLVVAAAAATDKRAWLNFTYEEGDVIGGFATKVARALTKLGVPTEARANWNGATFFWHSGYRPTQWTPTIQPWQNVFFNLENFHVDALQGETLLQTRYADPDQVLNPRVLHVPWAWVAFEHRYQMPSPHFLLRKPDYNAAQVAAKKTRFCAFLAQQCYYEKSYLWLYGSAVEGVKQPRTRFFEALNESYYKRVDALGHCYHNRDEPPVPEEYKALFPGWSQHDSFIYLMRDYKFAMAFENMATPGYFTEKLFNAYLGGTVPIYWGDPRVDELVNTEAFVWCKELPEDGLGPWGRCIDRIITLDKDPIKYQHVLSQPILKGNRLPSWMSFPVLARKLLRGWDMIDPATRTYRRHPRWDVY